MPSVRQLSVSPAQGTDHGNEKNHCEEICTEESRGCRRRHFLLTRLETEQCWSRDPAFEANPKVWTTTVTKDTTNERGRYVQKGACFCGNVVFPTWNGRCLHSNQELL